MEDFVIIDGDLVQFLPAFPPANVIVQMGRMSATRFPPSVPGSFTVNGKAPCVEGDEQRVMVPGCIYMTPQFSIPGIGTLKIEMLTPSNLTQAARIGGKRVIVRGTQFPARFEVQSPARQPPTGASAPMPDPITMYRGLAMFVTTNTTKKLS
jgi:hypothetical protein